jgi:hypothetical protein
MAKSAGEAKKVVKTLEEFEKKYLPNSYKRKMLEAEMEEPDLFVERIVAPFFKSVRRELRK